MTTYRTTVQDHLVCCLLIETRGAVEAIEEICALPGLDIIVPAQFDLSTALVFRGSSTILIFVAAVTRIKRAALDAGLPLGGVAFSRAQAETLLARGYRIVAGFDVLWLRAQATEMRN